MARTLKVTVREGGKSFSNIKSHALGTRCAWSSAASIGDDQSQAYRARDMAAIKIHFSLADYSAQRVGHSRACALVNKTSGASACASDLKY